MGEFKCSWSQDDFFRIDPCNGHCRMERLISSGSFDKALAAENFFGANWRARFGPENERRGLAESLSRAKWREWGDDPAREEVYAKLIGENEQLEQDAGFYRSVFDYRNDGLIMRLASDGRLSGELLMGLGLEGQAAEYFDAALERADERGGSMQRIRKLMEPFGQMLSQGSQAASAVLSARREFLSKDQELLARLERCGLEGMVRAPQRKGMIGL